MATPCNKKKLVASFIHFVRQEIADGKHTEDEVESLEVACQCLETGFSMEQEDLSFQPSRPLVDSFVSVEGLSRTETAAPAREPSEDEKKRAEELKNEGNNLMRNGQFEEAVQKYNEAITLYQNAVYFCNRAAAYGKLEQHDLSIQDCRKAVGIDPTYSKAYGRMGLALSCQNRYAEAVDAYTKALELEPGNDNYQNNLNIARERAGEQQQQQHANPAAANPFGAVGGLDIGNLLNNPAMMNMATQVMSDPNMQNLMSNLMSGMSNQQGGQQGLSGLLQAGERLASQMQNANPELVEQLRNQFQQGGPDSNPPGGNNGNPNNQNPPSDGGAST